MLCDVTDAHVQRSNFFVGIPLRKYEAMYQIFPLSYQKQPPEVFLGKGALKICNKFIGERP